MMVGRELTQMYPRQAHQAGDTVMEVQNWTVFAPDVPERPVVKNVSFSVRKGEILGFAGLIGSGRTELAMNLIGAWGIKGGGKLILEGKELGVRSPREAIKAGISCLSENRKEQGLVLLLGVKENITAAAIRLVSRMGIIDHSAGGKRSPWLCRCPPHQVLLDRSGSRKPFRRQPAKGLLCQVDDDPAEGADPG